MTSLFSETVKPQRIILARESRGMLQSALAREVEISQGNLSKIESGLLGMSSQQLERAAQALSYPKEFFFEPVEIYPVGLNYYRKNKGIPNRLFRAIEAYINLRRTEIEKLLRSVEFKFERKTPKCEIDDEKYGSPEVIAQSVRAYWRLPGVRLPI